MKLIYGIKIDEDGNPAINEYEIEAACLIYESYLSGMSLSGISKMLAEQNIPSPTGKETWSNATLDKLLLNKYYFPVVGEEKYYAAQFEKDRRSTIDPDAGKRKATKYDSRNVLSGLFVCAECGRSYRRVQQASGETVWRCANRVEHGSRICKSSPTVTEEVAIRFVCDSLSISEIDPQEIRNSLETVMINQDGSMTADLICPDPLLEMCL